MYVLTNGGISSLPHEGGAQVRGKKKAHFRDVSIEAQGRAERSIHSNLLEGLESQVGGGDCQSRRAGKRLGWEFRKTQTDNSNESQVTEICYTPRKIANPARGKASTSRGRRAMFTGNVLRVANWAQNKEGRSRNEVREEVSEEKKIE